MFESKTKKFTSMALAAMISISILGTTSLAAASPAHHPGWENRQEEPSRPLPPPPKERHPQRSASNTHSQGEVITAGVVGAVVGAILAKNT